LILSSTLPSLLLLALLAGAVWHDVRTRRIPNALVAGGMVAALALHAWLPAGAGLFAPAPGSLGMPSALGGLALGLAVLMPLYALRLMGAGDVKLLAMVGAFVGAGQILALALVTLVTGGVLALAVAAWQRKLRRLVGNAGQMVLHGGLSALAGGMRLPGAAHAQALVAAPVAASGRLPYALAIASATVLCVLWLRLAGELPL
jgi:prepilin peptidase CpaA